MRAISSEEADRLEAFLKERLDPFIGRFACEQTIREIAAALIDAPAPGMKIVSTVEEHRSGIVRVEPIYPGDGRSGHEPI